MRRPIFATVLAAELLLLSAGPAAAGSDGSSPVVGVWAGARTVRERGGCRLDDAAKVRRTVTLTVRLAPNGSPIGELAFADAPGAVPQPWTGAVDNGRVTFEAAQSMTCRGATHQYVVRPTGSLPKRAERGATLRLTAEDGLCGCGFGVRYDLKWIAAVPAPAQP